MICLLFLESDVERIGCAVTVLSLLSLINYYLGVDSTTFLRLEQEQNIFKVSDVSFASNFDHVFTD